jgi:predicted small lipoprotein YifL
MNLKRYNFDYCFLMRYKPVLRLLMLFIIVSGLAECTSALYFPDQNNVTPGSNLDDLKAGRQLYVNKCGSCHSLFLPEKYSTEQWPALVDKMEIKSNICSEEKSLILNYLTKGMISRHK